MAPGGWWQPQNGRSAVGGDRRRGRAAGMAAL